MTTIADVARAAGVSISTVSYVMSGKRTISEDTRERVQQAIVTLGYQPHASARSLASRRSNVIGLQVPLRSGVDVHVVMEIVAGIISAARARHYDILLLTGDDETALDRAVGSSMVDALLVMDVSTDDPRIPALRASPVPAVLIGVPADAEGLTVVDFDFAAAGRQAAIQFADDGHHRVALIGAPPEVLTRHTSYAERLSGGFLDAAAERAVAATVHAFPSSADAADSLRALLAESPEITAVLVHNEGALPHIAPALADRDVIALCPVDVARSVPGIHRVIELPADALGTVAAGAVLDVLDGRTVPTRTLLPPAPLTIMST